jgi:AcrR family transcriptional regulator
MQSKKYHHGDLRNALIEVGISLINENGLHQFSLRKVSAACGVSHSASYSHFKDINALIHAMGEHVTAQFMEKLEHVLEEQKSSNDIITLLGKAYIEFFTKHPNYFQFLFYQSGITINLDDDSTDDYPPFTLFRNSAYQTFEKMGIPRTAQKQILVTMWAMVHGLVSLLTNKNIKYSGDWAALLDSAPLLRGGSL